MSVVRKKRYISTAFIFSIFLVLDRTHQLYHIRHLFLL
nr:MAG TPA: hypothetical protein [Caudoviricetes sp.]